MNPFDPTDHHREDVQRVRPTNAALEALKPALPQVWLIALAGLTWTGVGIFLCRLAATWLAPLAGVHLIWRILLGLTLAGVIAAFGFSKLAGENLQRIRSLPRRACIFAFQEWKSYPLVVVMVAMGIALRSSPLPKTILAILYIGIGGALFLASLRYYCALPDLKHGERTA
jgi:hypothetical protein